MLTLAALPFGLFAVAWPFVARAYLTVPLQMGLRRRLRHWPSDDDGGNLGTARRFKRDGRDAVRRASHGGWRVDDVTLLGTLPCKGRAVYAVLLLALCPQWWSIVVNAGRALRKAEYEPDFRKRRPIDPGARRAKPWTA